jgi:hypothetical protein
VPREQAIAARRGTETTRSFVGDNRRSGVGDIAVGDAVKAKQAFKEKETKKEIPLKDKILLGPIDKYRKYNRFPWKFLLHIIMIIMTTFQVLYVCNYSSDYAYNAR